MISSGKLADFTLNLFKPVGKNYPFFGAEINIADAVDVVVAFSLHFGGSGFIILWKSEQKHSFTIYIRENGRFLT